MRTKLLALGAAVALSASALAITGGPVYGQTAETDITVEVNKEVVNPPLQETSFTVKLSCTDGEHTDTATETIDWRKPGNSSWKLLPPTVYLTATDEWDDDVTCVVSETNSGGATTSTITCDDTEDATCDGATLYIDEEDLGAGVTYGEFTVVNDFTPAPTTTTTAAPVTPVAPATPAAVPVAPRVTG